MDILEKHTAQFFGATQTIHRSGKVFYKAHGGNNSELWLYANGRQVQRTVNYSTQRKSNMALLDRVLYR